MGNKANPPVFLTREEEDIKRFERLAHGIRTPLHTVLGTSELLHENSSSVTDKAHLASVIQATQTALNCLDTILTEFKFMQVSGVITPAGVADLLGNFDEKIEEKHAIACRKNSPKILVVDDNATSSRLAKDQLERAGFRTVTAISGEEAIVKFKEEDFDLVLLDLEMPVLNGFQTYEKLRDEDTRKNKRTPIVALTADSACSSAENALFSGFDAYLVKPLTRADLIKSVKEFVEG